MVKTKTKSNKHIVQFTKNRVENKYFCLIISMIIFRNSCTFKQFSKSLKLKCCCKFYCLFYC